GATVLQDDFRQRGEQAVDELRQLVRRHPLRDGGEVPHIAEHQRHLAHDAAELELLRVGDDLVHHRRRDVVTESPPHLARPLVAPLTICSIAWAWISTPGTAASSGVARRSRRPGALAPTSTIRPLIWSGSFWPASTFHAGMYAVRLNGRKCSQMPPSASVG